MGEVQRWLSVRIQRHLGFETAEDVAGIVSSIMEKRDPKDIELALVDMLGSDEAAEEIISTYFKKISVPRPVTVHQPVAPVYAAAAESSARSIGRDAVYESRKKEDDDLGYGALVKKKKKGGNGGNKDNYQRVGLGAEGRSMQGGNLVVMKKVKKGARGDGSGVDSAPEIRERLLCGCQARLHPFVNNCLRCGRIVCLQEDVGPCFFCGHFVTPQGTPQITPFTLTPTTPGNEEETEGNPDAAAATPQQDARSAAGLAKAQENLARLLQFDRTSAERTTVYDDQADYFDMSNRWISADERMKLAKKEAELVKAKTQATNTLVLDFAGRSVVASVQSKEETHARFQEQLLAQMKSEQAQQKLMDREEAEEQQKLELERIKGHLKHRPDGSIFVVPTMEVPAPEFVSRAKDAHVEASKGPKPKKSSAVSSPPVGASPAVSLASSGSIPIQGPSRLQTDFFPEVEIEELEGDTPQTGVVIESNAGASVQVRGIAEGFSGAVWTADDRLEMLEWMHKEVGGNFYMWAPFDDPMHRRLWNYLFSDEEVANLKSTIAKCNAMGIEFNLAIRPHAIDFRSILHTDALARKILQAYEQCGCRSFSIIFADEDRNVPTGCRSLSSAQSDLVNALIQVVDEFIKLKTENSAEAKDGSQTGDQKGPAELANNSANSMLRWLVCPTVYTSKLEPGQEISVTNYLRELNRQLDSRIELLWSGPEAPAATLDAPYMTRCKQFFGQKRHLFFWDRVPQCPPPYDLPANSSASLEYNSRAQSVLDVYDNRSPQLGSFFRGALVSTLSAPVPSRITLGTALQFFRNTTSYNAKEALLPAIQKYVLNEKGLVAALKSVLSVIPPSRMTDRSRAPSCLNRGDQEERAFWTELKTNLNRLDSAQSFPARRQFDGPFSLVREMVNMNLAWYDYVKDPKTNAGTLTSNIRIVRASLMPVLYTEYDLTQYRNTLFAHPIGDKSLRGDVQRTYTKFKAANMLVPKDSETKDLVIRLAAECTVSMRELEAYLIQDYWKEDLIAWRTFLNNLFFRDASKAFLHKMPPVTTPPSPSPNVKILELRSSRIKAKLAEEKRLRDVAVKFALASQLPSNEDDSDDEDLANAHMAKVDGNQRASSSAASSSASAASLSSSVASPSSGPAKKVYPSEVKELPIRGMRYIRNFLSEDAESILLASIDNMEWDTELSRRIQQYGFKFLYRVDQAQYNTERLEIAAPMPQFLKDLGDELMNGKYVPVKPDQVIINEYTPGQGIRHHIDNVLSFEDCIISISLGSAAVMEFANSDTGEKISWLLEPRSLLILQRDARLLWSHSIASRTEDIWNGVTIPRDRRVSVTMRKVKHSVAKALFDAKTKKK
jgi:alkylated DNA repair dioxygenase AlkB